VVEIVAPEEERAAQTVLFCLPGGGMSRRYFDLAAPDYSFAERYAERDCVVVLIDHPGVGESDVPQDGWALDPATITAIEHAVIDAVFASLQDGVVPGVSLSESVRLVGVGHSMGAGLLIWQQALHRSFDAIAVLGWSSSGLPEYLGEDHRELAGDSQLSAEDLVAFAKQRGDDPLPTLPRGSSELLVKNSMPSDVHAALADARSPLLLIAGHSSMIPGVSRWATVQIEAPVFIGVGELDIARDAEQLPAEFPAAAGVALCVLPGAGHNHTVEPNREVLWAAMDAWIQGLPTSVHSTSPSARSIVFEAS
jgi:pimeloyl-ACP methyl ester carboxylesterase